MHSSIRKILLCIAVVTVVKAEDNVHFYRATNFTPLYQEPRLGRPRLTSLDFSLGAGTTRHAFNSDGQKVPLFDIYGPTNILELGVGVPDKDLSSPLDLILNQLALEPSNGTFGKLSFSGRFIVVEGIALYTQNLEKGFFIQAHLPVRHFIFKDIDYCDLSPAEGCPNITSPIWQTFLTNFCAILDRYCLSLEPTTATGIGDLTLAIGWTYNYQDASFLDYVDTSMKLGLLFPTGKKRNPDKVFSLPFGYNGHFGVDFSADFALGVCDWLTFGAYLQGLIFAKSRQCIRMKTGVNQSGIIYLAKGEAVIEEGAIWLAGTYVKADHFVGGLSFLLGYSYAHKASSEIRPCDCCRFDPTIVNTDESLKSFTMHTIHVLFDYDFNYEENMVGPRLGIFYNRPVAGKRVFETPMAGAVFGIDVAWPY